MEAPIPTPRQDDDEDVHWALSTAGALWARGEHTEALKWLRRAAEQASDVNADIRALELFKAAADVATRVNTPSAAPPPPPVPSTPPVPMGAAPPNPRPASAPPPAAPMGAAPPNPSPASAPPPRPQAASLPPNAGAPRPSVPPQTPSAQAAPKPSAPPPPQRKPPAPPPRPGSMYPPPPVVPAAQAAPQQPRSPSVPVPAARMAPEPQASRLPPQAGGPNAVPKPALPSAAAVQAPAVTPPRAVAIITAKPAPAPQAATPKRRRSFTGEARPVERSRAAEPARAHRVGEPRRRRTFDDEATLRHVSPVAAPAQDAAAPKPPFAPEPSSIFDDLDEDTRVLQNRPVGGVDDVIEQAFDRLRSGGAAREPASPPAAVDPAPPAPAAEPEPPVAFFAPAAAVPAPSPPAPDETDDGPSSAPSSQNTKVWSLPDMERPEPQTQRPASIADGDQPAVHQAPAPAPRRLDTLPSLRVAVLATSVPGEVRLIALEAKDEAPPGAALAVLVPLSAADGEAVARLFGGQD